MNVNVLSQDILVTFLDSDTISVTTNPNMERTGQSALTFKVNGAALGTEGTATVIDFTGSVTATRSGSTITYVLSGGSGGWATSTDTTTLTGSPTIAMGTNSTRVTGLGGGFIFNYDRLQTTQTPLIIRGTTAANSEDFSIQYIETDFNNGDNRSDGVVKIGWLPGLPGGSWWAWENYFEGRSEMIMETMLENGQSNRRQYWYMHRTTGVTQSFFTTDSHEFRPSTTDGSQAAAYLSLSTTGLDTYGAYSITKGATTDAGHFSASVGVGGAVTILSDGAGNDARLILQASAGLTSIGLHSFNNAINVSGTSSFSNDLNVVGASSVLGLGPEFLTQYITAGTAGGAMDFHGPSGYYYRWYNGATVSMTLYAGNQLVVGASSPTTASVLAEFVSTTQGVVLPRMTTTQRNNIASPTAGMMIYNSTTNKMNLYTTGWEAVTSA